MGKVINQTHKKVAVYTCELNPVANEDLGIRKNNSNI